MDQNAPRDGFGVVNVRRGSRGPNITGTINQASPAGRNMPTVLMSLTHAAECVAELLISSPGWQHLSEGLQRARDSNWNLLLKSDLLGRFLDEDSGDQG